MILDPLRGRKQAFIGVCSYGRSGSTLLMNLLRAHGVAVLGDVPFEDRTTQACYLASLRLAMGESGTGRESAPAHRAETFQGISYFSSVDTRAAGARQLDERYAAFLDAQVPAHAPGVAEKFVGINVMRMMKANDFGSLVKLVLLVRDPRDVFISVKQFNAKRGSEDFNAASGDRDLFRGICDFARMQVSEAGRGGALLCHYEDIVLRRPQTMVALLQHVGVRAISPDAVARAWDKVHPDERALRHMTSANQGESVARWRREEFRAYQDLFAEHQDAILRIGYL